MPLFPNNSPQATEPTESAPNSVIQEEANTVGNTAFEEQNATSHSQGGQALNGVVEINDETAPLVVLFGPTSCGKTMTLIRLTQFLRKQGYGVQPDASFRPSYDQQYKDDCDKFNQTVNDPIAAPGTSGYMLVDVIAKSTGKVLCKILEAPGEYYFDPKQPNKSYPHYLNRIIDSPNRKVWCAFVEPAWENANTRANYVNRIEALKPQMSSQDRIIFVFNKIDKTNFVKNRDGVVNEKEAIKYVSDLYKQIFDKFKCEIPIVKWFRPYDCGFIPFQTGKFTETKDEYGNTNILFSISNDAYPSKLWNAIKRSI
ncbi:MAG: hypothetical protein IKR25_04540 [Muribaculaceae bacterium]|nr:hypothetical protein [Muribaculaceae bacterium]